MDGVDIAIIETDGQEIVTLGRTGFFPYAEADRVLLRGAAGLLGAGRRHDHQPTCGSGRSLFRDGLHRPRHGRSHRLSRPHCFA
ncbi:MAG: anhydro-N-acetylmuramic acid kinase, partial [Methylocella sp.]